MSPGYTPAGYEFAQELFAENSSFTLIRILCFSCSGDGKHSSLASSG